MEVEPDTLPCVAEMFVVPPVIAVARPPAEVMVAIAGIDEAQVTLLVMFSIVPSV